MEKTHAPGKSLTTLIQTERFLLLLPGHQFLSPWLTTFSKLFLRGEPLGGLQDMCTTAKVKKKFLSSD